VALTEPGIPDPSWPRYSKRAFPRYRFVAGLNPHPRRDPGGHSYGQPETPPPYVTPERWPENEPYLHGVDLYNFGYWWECHEELEGLWHLTGHRGTESQYLQGIIQIAAANLKRHVGSRGSARRLAQEGRQRLASIGLPRFMGLELEPFERAVREYHEEETRQAVPLLRLQ
jgi:hypothetical protein